MGTTVTESPNEAGAKAKITLPLKSLQQALAKISPALPGASCGIPVLQNVRVESTADGLTFTASNLDMAIRAKLEPQEKCGAFLLPSERLMGYVKLLDGDDVVIAPGKRRATVTCGRSKTQLPTSPIANYPSTAFDAGTTSLMLHQDAMLRLVRHTSFAASTEESRYLLGGALLECEGEQVRMVATDGHRLASYMVPLTGYSSAEQDMKSALIPLQLIKALERSVEDSEEMGITLTQAGESIGAWVGGDIPLTMNCRKLAGAAFPNYKAVIPAGDMAAVVTVNSTEMLAAVRRCVAMSDRESVAIRLTISPTAIRMHAVDINAGETDEVVDVTASGEFAEFTTGFNGDYLADALKVCSGEVEMRFATADANVPMTMKHSPKDGEEFLYVVMPLRV